MQSKQSFAPVAGAISLALALAACAAPDQGRHGRHQHQGGPESGPHTASPAAGMGKMDKQSMCDMHRKMKGGQPESVAGGTEPGNTPGSPDTARPKAGMMEQRCQ